jgi:cytochrome c peroxidase
VNERALLPLLPLVLLAACAVDRAPTAEQLGRRVFFDPKLSNPSGQACADCHAPRFAFRDPESDRTTSMGVVPGRFGARNAPSLLYAGYVPPLHFDAATQRWIGGLFWDGRATNLEEQAAGPLLNPLEMNNPDKGRVVAQVRAAAYADTFRQLFGPHALDDVDTAFAHVSEVLAAYERSPELSPFASRYDRYIAGEASLSRQEQRGLALFEEHCATCHPPPLFTDFSYANLGIPKYANGGFYRLPPQLNPGGLGYVDHGLAATLGDPAQDGKFRVPTLRNVMRTAPYSHNGYFENVPYLIDFLATRDIGSSDVETCSRAPGAHTRCGWPAPEVPATIDRRIGHMSLGAQDIADLLAFLETLTDHVP